MECRCACGLDIIVGYFNLFFHIVILVIFHPEHINSGYFVSTTPHTIVYQSCWNFEHVFSIVWRCACAFDKSLRQFFVTFFYFVNFVIFLPRMYRQWVPCDCNYSYNFIPVFLKLCTCFLQGLQMFMWFEFFFNLFLSLFFTLLTVIF